MTPGEPCHRKGTESDRADGVDQLRTVGAATGNGRGERSEEGGQGGDANGGGPEVRGWPLVCRTMRKTVTAQPDPAVAGRSPDSSTACRPCRRSDRPRAAAGPGTRRRVVVADELDRVSSVMATRRSGSGSPWSRCAWMTHCRPDVTARPIPDPGRWRGPGRQPGAIVLPTGDGRGEYLYPRSENLTDPARRLFATGCGAEVFSANKPPQRATVDLGCSFDTQNLRASPAGLHTAENDFIFPGHFPGGASSRRHGVCMAWIPVYCLEEI